MDELIKRQDALDALCDACTLASVKSECIFKNLESCMDYNAILDVPTIEEQWIPVSERLPEEYGEYLITWETSKATSRFIGFAEGEETGVWDDQHDRFVFSWLPEDYIIERYPDWRVIAWMPLPEPYKGEQE